MTILLASILLTHSAQSGSPGRDYPFEIGFAFGISSRIDALSIVSPARRTEANEGYRIIDEATVVASNGLGPGKSIRMVTNAPSPFSGPFRALTPGHKYLMLAVKQKDGKLVYPSNTGDPLGDHLVPAQSPNEVSCLAAFETHKTALSDGKNAQEILYNSVADCLQGADRETAHLVCTWLANSKYPGFTENDVFGHREFPLSVRIREIALASPPEQRAYMYLTLNTWCVYGYADLYRDAIEDCASNPTAFDDVPEVPKNPYYENQSTGLIPADFRHRYSSARWAKAVLSAKNQKVFHFLVASGYVEPGSKYEPQIAALLDDKDAYVRYWTAAGFAYARHDFAHYPKQVKSLDPKTFAQVVEYPNLDEMVSYWKKQLGVPKGTGGG